MAKRKVRTAQQASQNWKNAMSAPLTAQKYTQGVQAVTESPMAAAAAPAAQQRYLAGTQAAVSSGSMARALNAKSLSDWASAATGVGAQRLAQAAQKGGAKMDKAAAVGQNIWQAQRDAASAIPKGVKGDLANAAQRWQASASVQQQMWKAAKGG